MVRSDRQAARNLQTEAEVTRGPLYHHFVLGMDAGTFARQPIRPLAHVLIAAADEAALYIVAADDPVEARAQMRQTLARLIEAL